MILETGALASHFTLLGTDGREYSLPRDLDGRPALLVFFKTTCGTCDITFPYLNRLRQTYPEGWAMWAISQDAADRATRYAAGAGIECPVLIDAPAYYVSKLYDPPATPTMFLVGPDGRVEYSNYGFAKADINEIAGRIAQHLGAPAQVIAPQGDGRPDMKPG
ncbi:MAG TPA: TlpA disulfide reductase family protein [Dehalococcoidia bacterium]|nr:TlpA disulfide reductase family protein [Dehalococcoidia bacterium]